MEAVVRNTAIQGWLSVIFVVLSIIVIATAVLATLKAFRSRGDATASKGNEDPSRPSRVFAPAGLIPTPAEKELMAEWDKVPAELRFERAGHH
jgi:carbon starvation protein